MLPGVMAVRYDQALALAEQAYLAGQPGQALRHLAGAAKLAERRALPHVLTGQILLDAGRPADALLAFDRAIQLDSHDEAALTGFREALDSSGSPALPVTPARERGRQRSRNGSPVRMSARQAVLVLVPYLVMVTVAEAAVTFINPMLVFPLHGGMIAILATHIANLERRAGRDPASRYLAAVLMTMMLSPLIRVISLTLPLAQLPDPHQYLFAGIPMTVGALIVARYVGFRRQSIGLVWRGASWQLLAVLGSVIIGLAEYLILQPEPLGDFPWTAAGWLPALSVAFATGFPEELIFRGMMQTALRPLISTGWNVLYVSIVFAVLHLGYQSGIDLVFVFGASLFYGWIFERSRSIIGVSIGHGLANAILFFVAPNLSF